MDAYRSLDELESELRFSTNQQSTFAMNPKVEECQSIASSIVTSPSATTIVPTSQFQCSAEITKQLNSSVIESHKTEEGESKNTKQTEVSSPVSTAPVRRTFTTVPESCIFGTEQSVNFPALAQFVNATVTLPQLSSVSAFTSTNPSNAAMNQFRLQSSASNAQNLQSTFSDKEQSNDSTNFRVIRGLQRGPTREAMSLEDLNELEEFIGRGEEYCINDMKKFITQYSLRQTTVAQMTGVSQPYISKLLNGNHNELSRRCRRNIYAWFLNCRKNPAIYCQDPTTRLETNGDGELVPQRRERYVFRPLLIRILESFFADSPFPDAQRRSEIAQACNHALQSEKRGQHLMPKEIVTPQVIANWFANKRKEVRRRSNEEIRARNAANTSLLSDSTSTPSPSNSTNGIMADSPNAVASTLLPPLTFANPLAFFVHHHQQQQNRLLQQISPAPVPGLLESGLPFNQLGSGITLPPLTELLNRSVQMATTNTGLNAGSPPSIPHLLSPMTTQSITTPISTTPAIAGHGSFDETDQQPRPPVLYAIVDEKQTGSPTTETANTTETTVHSPTQTFKLMNNEDDSGAATNVDAYRELLQNMFGNALFQQHFLTNSAITQNIE
ncbi:Homeobox domain-containing protein [Aphelenchoides besseyi]|nr:Homeobox domain-containing protein [Aphelenchoides besseyi]